MKAEEIRKKFINFFKEKEHVELPSSPLVPDTVDPSVLFTTAGMQQFKSWFSGEEKPKHKRVVTIQPCVRTSDISEVGDETHLTFFEMLGNFSFSNYFKEEAIKWAWDFLTSKGWLGIDKKRISATYFGGGKNLSSDKESLLVLQKLDGLKNIKPAGFEDNFWSLGTEGSPGGPTVEFYIDDMEVWNLVFNEYQLKNGKYEPSKYKGVDTGMGLERLTSVLQGKNSVFANELFRPVTTELEKLAGMEHSKNRPAFRIINDHLRAAVFFLSGGVLPSNKFQGYVLRRLIRRAIVKGRQSGIEKSFTSKIASIVKDIYRDVFYNINIRRIKNVLDNEEDKFDRALDDAIPRKNKRQKIISRMAQGYPNRKDFDSDKKWILDDIKYISPAYQVRMKEWMKKLNEAAVQSSMAAAGASIASGAAAFRLESSYGYPKEFFFDEVSQLANNIDSDLERQVADDAIKKHQEISRAGRHKKFGAQDRQKIARLHSATHILHEVLRRVLGKYVEQRGQDINSERLRFDFSHPAKLTEEQLKEIEDKINEIISQSLPIECEEVSVKEAKKQGARALFLDKYKGKVTMYSVGDYSKELCKGPHVRNTKEIGKFKIIKEEASSAGIRRIRGVVE